LTIQFNRRAITGLNIVFYLPEICTSSFASHRTIGFLPLTVPKFVTPISLFDVARIFKNAEAKAFLLALSIAIP